MGKTTTFLSRIRSTGGGARGVVPPTGIQNVLICAFSATAASAPARVGTSATTGPIAALPKGAKVLHTMVLAGATGGTNPTVDIGTSADGAYFYNELDADLPNALTAPTGTHAVERATGTGLAADTVVYGGVGASAAASGTMVVAMFYVIHEDGKEDSAV